VVTNYKAIAKKLKFEERAFINGRYINAINGKKFETINQVTGEKLCMVAKCNHKDVDIKFFNHIKYYKST
jgi:acyl-CoA reductase-like NAD-dependent aldehyde dehydrogenase